MARAASTSELSYGRAPVKLPKTVETEKILPNAVEIKSRQSGKRERDIVLIHGFGGGSWDPLPEKLGGWVWQVNPWKAPELGSRPSFTDAARLIGQAITQEISQEEVPLYGAGYSLGGPVLEQLALLDPDLFERIVLLATTNGKVVIPPSYAAWKVLNCADRTDDILERYGGDAYGGMVRQDWRLAKEAGVGGKRDEEIRSRQGAAALKEQFSLNGIWCNLRRLKTAALIITGGDDPMVDSRHSQILHESIRHSQLDIIKDEGHLFPLLLSELTADCMNEFFDEPNVERRLRLVGNTAAASQAA